MECLRNDIRFELQNLRKDLELTMSYKLSLYIDITTDTNWFTSFFSPNLKYKDVREGEFDHWQTNCEYLLVNCSLYDLVGSVNGLYFDGISPVHNSKIETMCLNGKFLKEVYIPFELPDFTHTVIVKFYELPNFD